MSIAATLLATLGKIGLSMLMSLLTEGVLKKAIVVALEHLSKRTATDEDDKLVQIIKDAWKV